MLTQFDHLPRYFSCAIALSRMSDIAFSSSSCKKKGQCYYLIFMHMSSINLNACLFISILLILMLRECTAGQQPGSNWRRSFLGESGLIGAKPWAQFGGREGTYPPPTFLPLRQKLCFVSTFFFDLIIFQQASIYKLHDQGDMGKKWQIQSFLCCPTLNLRIIPPIPLD